MFEFKINGMEKTKDSFNNRKKLDKIKDVLIKGGFAIESEAKRTSRVDTGRLRASYSTNWDGSGFQRASIQSPAVSTDGVSQPMKTMGDIAIVRIGTNVEYAFFIEYGTRSIPPFMTINNAAMKWVPKITQMLNDVLGEPEKNE